MEYFANKRLAISSNKLLLFLILGAGIVLRCWNYFQIPYTYDEFGVVYTSRLKSFADLLTLRILPDGHPAGMTVFSFYWMKLFGIDTYWVKLPFIIFGIWSVYHTWLIGKKWFSNSTGIIVASYVAYLQYFVMYSQIARPYISGLFFVLLMVNAWTNLIFKDEKKGSKNYIVYIIASVLCAYNHHFSLLFAIIVGITGLFFCRKEMLKRYIIGGMIIFLLYLPHLKILFHQLQTGGLGWVTPPANDYLLNYLYYSFQFSFLTIASVILIIVFAVLFSWNKGFYKQRFFILSLIWFFLPFIIGFTYSRLISPVIQYSVLIFSYPFFLLAILSPVREMKPWQNLICAFIIALTVIPDLIFERQHYNYFYHSLPVCSYHKINQELKSAPQGSIDVIVDCPAYVNYYFEQKKLFPASATLLDSISTLASFQKYVSLSKAQKLLYMESSAAARENYQMISKYFPKVLEHTSYTGGDYYVFAKKGVSTGDEIIFSDSLNLDNINASIGNYPLSYYLLDSITEYGKSYTLPLNKMVLNTNNVIDIQVKVKRISNNKNIILVASINDKDKPIFWNGGNLKNYIPETNQWTWLFYSFNLPDINLKNNNLIFSTYLWNCEKGNFLIADYKIQVRYGNPIIYGFIEKKFPAFDKQFIRR